MPEWKKKAFTKRRIRLIRAFSNVSQNVFPRPGRMGLCISYVYLDDVKNFAFLVSLGSGNDVHFYNVCRRLYSLAA